MIGSKLRRRRRQWSWTVCAGAGLVMIGVLFLQGRLGHRVWIAGGSSHEGVRDLDVLIDARQTFRPGSTTASHPWLSNAFCSPARLGVFCPKDAQSCASTATILVDDQNTADRMNMDWRFGNAALGGGASAGRRAIATAMRAGPLSGFKAAHTHYTPGPVPPFHPLSHVHAYFRAFIPISGSL